MTGHIVYYGYQNLICIMLYHISCIQSLMSFVLNHIKNINKKHQEFLNRLRLCHAKKNPPPLTNVSISITMSKGAHASSKVQSGSWDPPQGK